MGTRAYTAAEIARALGCSKQNVHLRLAAVACDREIPANGNAYNLAKAWVLESLPPTILAQLSIRAERLGFPNVPALLSESPGQYRSKIPLGRIAPHALAKARKLQQAMAEILPLHNDRSISRGELAQRGLAAYERVFGHKISDRQWRTWFGRVIERDHGAGEWSRLELYLQEDPPRVSRRDAASVARERRLEVLEDAITAFAGAARLDVRQKVYVWMKACDELQLQIESGRDAKRVKRAILKALTATGFFGADPETIRRNFNRQWSTFRTSGGILMDRRTTRNQRAVLPEQDHTVLLARTVDCGGRVSQAFREARDEGQLSAHTLDRTIANPRRKSYVPQSIRR